MSVRPGRIVSVTLWLPEESDDCQQVAASPSNKWHQSWRFDDTSTLATDSLYSSGLLASLPLSAHYLEIEKYISHDVKHISGHTWSHFWPMTTTVSAPFSPQNTRVLWCVRGDKTGPWWPNWNPLSWWFHDEREGVSRWGMRCVVETHSTHAEAGTHFALQTGSNNGGDLDGGG